MNVSINTENSFRIIQKNGLLNFSDKFPKVSEVVHLYQPPGVVEQSELVVEASQVLCGGKKGNDFCKNENYTYVSCKHRIHKFNCTECNAEVFFPDNKKQHFHWEPISEIVEIPSVLSNV